MKQGSVQIPDEWFSRYWCSRSLQNDTGEIFVFDKELETFESLWRTMTANQTGPGEVPSPLAWGEAFRAWLETVGTGFIALLDIETSPEELAGFKVPLDNFSSGSILSWQQRKHLSETNQAGWVGKAQVCTRRPHTHPERMFGSYGHMTMV